MESNAGILAPGALEAAVERAKELIAVKPTETKRKRLRPLNNWVLIKKQERKVTMTDEGLVTGVTEQERSDVGTVVAVAAGLVDALGRPLDVEVGDTVLYTHFALTIEDVQRLTGDAALQSVRGEEIYFVIEDIEPECT